MTYRCFAIILLIGLSACEETSPKGTETEDRGVNGHALPDQQVGAFSQLLKKPATTTGIALLSSLIVKWTFHMKRISTRNTCQ